MGKAYAYTRHGGPETERLLDRETPEPGPGQILIAVRAAGVNPVDFKLRDGYLRPGAEPPELPAVFGSEAAGTVVRTGPGVTGFAPGDRVFGSTLTGGYAEHTLLPAAVAAHIPATLSFALAATLPVAAATAHDALRQLAQEPGARLLLTGAGGGVGVAALQLARAAGLRVTGVSAEDKRDLVEGYGATHVPAGPGLADRLALALPDGADAVLDLVGGPVLEAAAALLTDRSRLVSAADRATVAALGGSPVARARTAAVLDEVARAAADGVLDPGITRTVPLERAGEALRAVESGHTRGKIVIEVGS